MFPSVYEWWILVDSHVLRMKISEAETKAVENNYNHCENSRCEGATMTGRSPTRAKAKRSGPTLSHYSALSLHAHTCAACVMICKKKKRKYRAATRVVNFSVEHFEWTLSRARDSFLRSRCVFLRKVSRNARTIFRDAWREEILMIHV